MWELTTMERLRGSRILVAVGGGIAAYKACELVRLLVKAGAEVRCAMTPAAQRFVSALTFQALSGRPVASDLWEASQELAAGHIALADWAQLTIVAPATADLLARARLGLADDVVTVTLLALPAAQVLFAPAMNEKMWASPALQEHVAVLRGRGAHFAGPVAGEMAERSHVGMGRLQEPAQIALAAAQLLVHDLEGVPVLITAGPTREALDPVRFLSNPSTGRMGFALAEAARDRGAQVTLIAGPTELLPPAGIEVVRIVDAAELAAQVNARAATARVVVMAAAVSDQRPALRSSQKVKKREGEELLRLVRTPDILAGLSVRFASQAERPLLVGFAAETEQLEEHAREKLVGKGLDLIVANDVTAPDAGFAASTNRVLILGRDGSRVELSGSKVALAHAIWDRIRARLSPAGPAHLE